MKRIFVHPYIVFCRSKHGLLSLLMLAATVSGCINDRLENDGEPVESVAINLALPGMTLAGSRADAPVTDATVSRVRVLAFDGNNYGHCALNTLIDSPADPFQFGLPSGRYDFYFIINEPDNRPDPAVGTPHNSILSGVVLLSQLEQFTVTASDMISPKGLYVMSAVQTGVQVAPDYSRPHDANGRYESLVSYADANGTSHIRQPQMELFAYRLATKVNLRLVLKKDGTPITNAETVKITRLPASVPVLDGVRSAQPATGETTLTAAPALPSFPADAANPTYAGYAAIIPSYLFRPKNDKAQAAQLYVKLADETTPRIMSLGHQLPAAGKDTDYTLHRNTLYHITGNVTDALELDIKVLDWDELALAPNLGFKWNGGDAIYLSSRSPIGLRRSGLLTADNYTFDALKVEIVGNDSRVTLTKGNSDAMKDRDNAVYSKFSVGDKYINYVPHLAGTNNQDFVLTQVGDITGDVATSVAANKQVTLRIRHFSFAGGYKDVTVYLNRLKWNNMIWMDRNNGATEPQQTGLYYYSTDPRCPTGYTTPAGSAWSAIGNSPTTYVTSALAAVSGKTYGEACWEDKATKGKLFLDAAGWYIVGVGYSNPGVTGHYLGLDPKDELSFNRTDFKMNTQTFELDHYKDLIFQVRCIKQ